MSVSAHIAAQRTDHGVPHAVSCRALGVAPSTFYKWHNRPPTPAKRRRAELDVEVKACFDASDGTYGSPRVRAALRRSGREVSKKTVESSMARQGLQGRARRRRRGLTRPDRRAEPVPAVKYVWMTPRMLQLADDIQQSLEIDAIDNMPLQQAFAARAASAAITARFGLEALSKVDRMVGLL